MEQELIIGIPGPWANRAAFLQTVVSDTKGEFIFGGLLLAHLSEEDSIDVDLLGFDPQMEEAFHIAGQGQISQETLKKIAKHKSVAYLHFPLDLLAQQNRISKFTDVLRRIGGYAVKIESSGVAHEWDTWSLLINSTNLFHVYSSVVVLIGDRHYYYSCGMHHFGLPESQVPKTMPIREAADFLNQFNYYQVYEKPGLAPGHTFSLTTNSPYYRINLLQDHRHPEDDLFHNPYGVWNLELV